MTWELQWWEIGEVRRFRLSGGFHKAPATKAT